MSRTTCGENSFQRIFKSEFAARGLSTHAGVSRPFNLFPAVPTTPRHEQFNTKFSASVVRRIFPTGLSEVSLGAI